MNLHVSGIPTTKYKVDYTNIIKLLGLINTAVVLFNINTIISEAMYKEVKTIQHLM